MAIQVVILAAGMGTRLGRPFPKPLTPLKDGRTILQQQLDNIRSAFGDDAEIMAVVGFKLDQILEAAPDISYAYNEIFDQTNTSKSLLKALRVTGDRGVLWMNGDVVFDPEVLRRVAPLTKEGRSFVCVDTATVAEEEVKYTVDADGMIDALSKQVVGALGEAIGINYVSAEAKPALIRRLDEVPDQEYFEGGMELGIAKDGLRFEPVDISDLWAVEVDFEEDLTRANAQFG